MKSLSTIRVLLVDDSAIALRILEQLLDDEPEISVVGKANDGIEALELLPVVRPDVICTDYHMPRMDGLRLVERLMQEHPLPILVVSVSVQDQGNENNIFALLQAGALDVLPKPRGGVDPDYTYIKKELVHKIRVLSGIKVFQRNPDVKEDKSQSFLSKEAQRLMATVPATLVAIGASTGGPPALQQILSELPADFPAPILCIQHISKGFLQGLVKWLDNSCALRVKIADDGEPARAGIVYLAPEDHHLTMDSRGILHTPSVPEAAHLPSVTVTFQSLAHCCGQYVVAVLLTGMGDDGATGLRDIANAGGITIAQDEASCAVFGMPRVAIEIGAARFVLPLAEIGQRLHTMISNGSTSYIPGSAGIPKP